MLDRAVVWGRLAAVLAALTPCFLVTVLHDATGSFLGGVGFATTGNPGYSLKSILGWVAWVCLIGFGCVFNLVLAWVWVTAVPLSLGRVGIPGLAAIVDEGGGVGIPGNQATPFITLSQLAHWSPYCLQYWTNFPSKVA